MTETANIARAPMSGPLRLGIIPTIGPFLLPKLMPLLRAAFPNLRLFLREDTTARLVDRLNANRLDVLLLALPCDCGARRGAAGGARRVPGGVAAQPSAGEPGGDPGRGAGGRAAVAAGGRPLPARTGSGGVRPAGGGKGRGAGWLCRDQPAYAGADGGRRAGRDVTAEDRGGGGGDRGDRSDYASARGRRCVADDWASRGGRMRRGRRIIARWRRIWRKPAGKRSC